MERARISPDSTTVKHSNQQPGLCLVTKLRNRDLTLLGESLKLRQGLSDKATADGRPGEQHHRVKGTPSRYDSLANRSWRLCPAGQRER